MPDAPIMQALNFVTDDALAGFRLHRLEVHNWGTFHGRVWSFPLAGHNALLTGDIGSGKSTLVDAITTLLVPAHRIAYNKAAGAEAKERSLRTYVLGHYKAERSDSTGSAKAVSLRDHRHYSVVLGHFRNEGFLQDVTLAQVFYMQDPQGQPHRFYVMAERELSIAQDFSGFGEDPNQLRKRLRAAGAVVENHFSAYSAWFRRRFGLDNEQALELFHQTVSMKSVGHLTDFVRQHMLEAFDVKPRIEALVGHVDDLNRAHGAILRAKKQLELLTPLAADLARHAALGQSLVAWASARQALGPHFAELKLGLLARRLALREQEARAQEQKVQALGQAQDAERQRVDDLKQALAAQGGDRLEQLARECRLAEEQLRKRQHKAERYAEWLAPWGEGLPEGPEAFHAQRQRLRERAEGLLQEEATLQNQLTELGVDLRQGKEALDALLAELASLKARRSNVPAQQVAVRQSLCQALGLDEAEVPFAGELLQVRDDALAWEGAAERLLHAFALSLLVPNEHYAAAAEVVDGRHWGGRLVYYRVRPGQREAGPSAPAEAMAHKLSVKPDSPFYAWLRQELDRRFDHLCCEDQATFRRATKAISLAGQIKAKGERHEKDDRHRLGDRSRYVLGWSNQAKIATLEAEAEARRQGLADLGAKYAATQVARAALQEQLGNFNRLDECQDHQELDWQALAREIARLNAERVALEAASDVLKALQEQLREAQATAVQTETQLREALGRQGALANQIETVWAQVGEAEAIRDALPAEVRDAQREFLDAWRQQVLGEHQLQVESCEGKEKQCREALQAALDKDAKAQGRVAEKVVGAMVAFKAAFSQEASEFDAHLDAGFEYQKLLKRLEDDDLPRFEAHFKELLNVNTINEVAHFNAQLNRERELIRERLDRINASLRRIDYNPGRFIVLEAQSTQDPEVRDFQRDLRACTEGSLNASGDDPYSEAKFLQVKGIVDRFRGREGQSELDRRWTAKVTDVRQWFAFAASERWREDGQEHEHYTDSGGKSGGQKEKLAYTILAASLAYQFGLEDGEVRSRSFRFVVIDEAFGRGSDESAQYALKLFEQLRLQLLIVTPLQKIHIIEPHVASLGFVHNEQGRDSQLRCISMAEHLAEKEARAHGR